METFPQTKVNDLIMQILAITGHEVCNSLPILVHLECWHKRNLTKGFNTEISVRTVDINDYQRCVHADSPAQREVALLHVDACRTKLRGEHHQDLLPFGEQAFPLVLCVDDERSAITLHLAIDSRMDAHLNA